MLKFKDMSKTSNNLWLLALFVPLIFISGCGDNEDKTESIIMGTSADMPPFEFYNTGGGAPQIIGFDIDIANAIGVEIGMAVRVQEMDFSALIPSLQSGRTDFVMASMTPTPARKRNIDFSEPYLVLPIAAVTISSTPVTTEKELGGKSVGVQLGSSHEQFVRDVATKDKTVKVISLNKLNELIQELKTDRIDVVIMETKTARSFQKINPELVISAIDSESVEFAVAFRKNSPWIEKFNNAINRLHTSGALENIRSKWFSENNN